MELHTRRKKATLRANDDVEDTDRDDSQGQSKSSVNFALFVAGYNGVPVHICWTGSSVGTTLIPISIAVPMAVGSSIGEGGAADVRSCTTGCLSGYTPVGLTDGNVYVLHTVYNRLAFYRYRL